MNKFTSALIALSLMSAPVFAAQVDGGTYVGAGIGAFQKSDTDGAGSLDAKGTGYTLYGGHQFNRIVGVELGYTDYADYKQSGTKMMSPTSLSASANLGYTFDNSIRPFVLVGLSYVDLNATDSAFAGDNSGTGLHFGVGVEYSPMENLTLRAISQADTVNIEDKITIAGNTVRMDSHDVTFSSVSLGVSYNF